MSFLSQPLQNFLITGRQIGTISVNVIVTENTIDALEITNQPVQQGAAITDHAFKKPVTLSMSIIMSGQATLSPIPIKLSEIYQKFITLQSSRVPFKVITPKRTYGSMLITALGMTTDKNTENCLAINVSMQQVILVRIGVAHVPAASQASPQKTQGVAPAGEKSAAVSFVDGFTSFLKGANQTP